MSEQNILFVVLLIWGIPSTYFRSRFRKIVYETDDWKINIKPLFKKELIALFSNSLPADQAYIKARFYLAIYLILFLIYYLSF